MKIEKHRELHEEEPHERNVLPSSGRHPGMSEEPGETSPSFAEQSPSEVHDQVKNQVKKTIAGFAGALEGLNEEIEEEHLPEKTEQAIHNLGETTRKVTSAAREETRETRDDLRKDKTAEGPRPNNPLNRTRSTEETL